jgi:hypothetical protein
MNLASPRVLVCLLTLGLVVTLFIHRDLPMVDLPQHAAQLAVWVHWGDPAYRTHDFELNFRTPYLLAYPLARVLAPVFGVVAALKIVVALALVAHVAAYDRLVHRLGHDPWLSLLGPPTALGYTFCFGFISFLVAMPIAFFTIVLALDHAERPTPRSGLALSGLLALTLLAHGLALALTMLAAGPLLLRGGGRFVARVAPLLAPVVLSLVWVLPGSSTARIGGTHWEISAARILELPGMLVGIGSSDPAASAVGLLLVACLGALLGAPSGRYERWLPLGASLAGFLAFPSLFRGVGPLSPRFAILLVPSLLLAFRPRRDANGRTFAGRLALAIVAISWGFVWTSRLPEFNRETEGMHALAAQMRQGLSVRPIVFDRESRAFPGVPALLHLPAYYQVEKGGAQGYSFAMYPISVVRYRPGVDVRMVGGLEWRPEAFDAAREAAGYDCFVVHSARDRTRELFGNAPDISLERRHGDWWLYSSRIHGDSELLPELEVRVADAEEQ